MIIYFKNNFKKYVLERGELYLEVCYSQMKNDNFYYEILAYK